MGEVWVADQVAPVQRRVAIKVVRPGLDSERMLARFEQERQALALMDHPNIPRVLDAGSAPSGRPYFVMELVRGVPVTDYCDAQKLAPNGRLSLFVQVCEKDRNRHYETASGLARDVQRFSRRRRCRGLSADTRLSPPQALPAKPCGGLGWGRGSWAHVRGGLGNLSRLSAGRAGRGAAGRAA